MSNTSNITADDIIMKFTDFIQGEDDQAKNSLDNKGVESAHAFMSLVGGVKALLHSKGKPFIAKVRYQMRKHFIDRKTGECRPRKTNLPPTEDQLEFVPTKAGHRLLCALSQFRDPKFHQLLTEEIETSPEIRYFIKCVIESNVLETLHRRRETGKPGIKELVRVLNDFVEDYRLVAKSPDFKNAVNANKRGCNKNRQGINELIDSVFTLHSRVVAIRLDCTYKRPKGMKDDEFNRYITEEQARADIEAFKGKKTSHELFKNALAYVIKMEMGPTKGIHFHVLLLLDGRQHRKDISIATMLGQHWVKLTDGRGMYFNCNLKWKGKSQCAVGTIHRDDQELRNGLKERVVTYMTKIDEYFQFLPLISGRTLFRSEVKKARAQKQVVNVDEGQDRDAV